MPKSMMSYLTLDFGTFFNGGFNKIMEQVFVNGLYFSIELIKILLVMVYIWKLTPKKNISYAFTICLVFVMCVSRFVDLSRVGLIYGMIIVIFMSLYLNGKECMDYV